MRRLPALVALSALAVLGAAPLAAAAAQPTQPPRVRVVRRDSTARDSLSLFRIAISTDSIEKMIRELLASTELEQTLGYALRMAVLGKEPDSLRLQELSRQMRDVTRRKVGLATMIQTQCAHEGPLPDGYLGVSFDQVLASKRGSAPATWEFGAVESVAPGSPAEKSGIQRGDVLLSIGGVDVRQPLALGSVLKPGKNVVVRLQRDGATKDVSVLIEKRPPEFGSECSTVEHLVGPEASTPFIWFKTPAPGRTPRAPEAGTLLPGGGGFAYVTPMALPGANFIAGATVMNLDDDWRETLGVDNGVLITKVATGTPARDAGLRASDVIIAADGEPVSTVRSLQRIITNAKSATVQLQVIRGGKTQMLTLHWKARERDER